MWRELELVDPGGMVEMETDVGLEEEERKDARHQLAQQTPHSFSSARR